MRLSQQSNQFHGSSWITRNKVLYRLAACLGIPPVPATKLSFKRCRGQSSFLRSIGRDVLANKPISTSLDLGSGPFPKNPFHCEEVFGVDIRACNTPNTIACDLASENLPFESNHFSAVTAFDLIEHIPRTASNENRRLPFLELMNEIYRVLEPGGIFFSQTPAFPFPEAFSDPTHVNIITEDTFPYYFCAPLCDASRYGFAGRFELLDQAWWDCWLLTALRKC